MTEFLIIAGVHLLAVISPGPDFIMVTTRTLQSGKKSGFWTALGLGLGILFHSFIALIGLGYVIEHSIILFSAIKIVGALYLLWMSWHLIRTKKSSTVDENTRMSYVPTSIQENIKTGILTNILNPKVSLFFLAIFSQIVSPETSLLIKSLYAGEMVAMTILWFSIVAWTIDKQFVRTQYLRVKHWIDRCMGVALGILGCKLLFVSKD